MPNNRHDTTDDDPSRSGIRFDRTINLGHVLTFIGFILTGLLAWSAMDKRVTVLEEARRTQEARDVSQDVRLREKMGEIRDSLTELKRGVEQVRDRLDKRL